MKYILVASTVLTLCLSGCSSNSGPFDPTLFKSPYSGITYTDEFGNLTGPVDSGDWQLAWGSSPVGFRAGKVIPNSYRVYYPYPNPFHGQTNLAFEIADHDSLSLWIVSESLEIVWSFTGEFNGGIIEVTWGGVNTQGEQVPDGIYRVYYEIGTDEPLSGFGDIWLTNSGLSWLPGN